MARLNQTDMIHAKIQRCRFVITIIIFQGLGTGENYLFQVRNDTFFFIIEYLIEFDKTKTKKISIKCKGAMNDCFFIERESTIVLLDCIVRPCYKLLLVAVKNWQKFSSGIVSCQFNRKASKIGRKFQNSVIIL